MRSDFSAPPDPNARSLFKRGLHSNFEPAGARLSTLIGKGDFIRDYDKLRQMMVLWTTAQRPS